MIGQRARQRPRRLAIVPEAPAGPEHDVAAREMTSRLALREAQDAGSASATLEAAGFRIDYLEDRALGTSPAAASRRYIAAFLGETMLIDNVTLD